MTNFYEYEFLKDLTGKTPPSIQDRIIGNLLSRIPTDNPDLYTVKFDLINMQPVICRK